jgi:hypothetical protein
MDEPIPLHRLFGLSWEDFFHGTSVTVEPEKDLSSQQQRLDVPSCAAGQDRSTVSCPTGSRSWWPTT